MEVTELKRLLASKYEANGYKFPKAFSYSQIPEWEKYIPDPASVYFPNTILKRPEKKAAIAQLKKQGLKAQQLFAYQDNINK